MRAHQRLLLTIPPEDLRLLRQLICKSKASLSPVEAIALGAIKEGVAAVNEIYLNVLALDRATLNSEAVLLATPECNAGKACIQLLWGEFLTIMALLEQTDDSMEEKGKYSKLWDELALAGMHYESRQKPVK